METRKHEIVIAAENGTDHFVCKECGTGCDDESALAKTDCPGREVLIETLCKLMDYKTALTEQQRSNVSISLASVVERIGLIASPLMAHLTTYDELGPDGRRIRSAEDTQRQLEEWRLKRLEKEWNITQ